MKHFPLQPDLLPDLRKMPALRIPPDIPVVSLQTLLQIFPVHIRFSQDLLQPSVAQKTGPVTDMFDLLKMGTDIEKGKPLLRIVPHDLIELSQFLFADKDADLVQHDQPVTAHHRPQQLHHHPLKGRQIFHSGVRGNIHADILHKGRKLPV